MTYIRVTSFVWSIGLDLLRPMCFFDGFLPGVIIMIIYLVLVFVFLFFALIWLTSVYNAIRVLYCKLIQVNITLFTWVLADLFIVHQPINCYTVNWKCSLVCHRKSMRPDSCQYHASCQNYLPRYAGGLFGITLDFLRISAIYNFKQWMVWPWRQLSTNETITPGLDAPITWQGKTVGHILVCSLVEWLTRYLWGLRCVCHQNRQVIWRLCLYKTHHYYFARFGDHNF